jgi:hypothetical protein
MVLGRTVFKAGSSTAGARHGYRGQNSRTDANGGGSRAGLRQLAMAAAFFADGTVSGQLTWIQAIAEERRKAYQDTGKALDMLNSASKDLVQQLVEWRNLATRKQLNQA